jgi:hypothetical protein
MSCVKSFALAKKCSFDPALTRRLRGAHDDLANAAAGAITEAMKHKSREISDGRDTVIVEGVSHWSPHLGSYVAN